MEDSLKLPVTLYVIFLPFLLLVILFVQYAFNLGIIFIVLSAYDYGL